MTPELWQRIEALYEGALALDPAQRDAYLAAECHGDTALQEQVARMLAVSDDESKLTDVVGQSVVALSGQDVSWEGRRIGPYRILKRIGRGGMGEVFSAVRDDDQIRQKVAIKTLRFSLAGEEALKRFHHERRTLSSMDHPHIARVLDAGAAYGSPYLTMEFVDGVPITQYADDHKLTVPQRLELLIPVCRAIQHAHQKGIVHRDIKPSNVLVSVQEGKPVPKVIDFGIAKTIEETGEAPLTLLTQEGVAIGTLDYMSPEQADPTSGPIDVRTDVYSLGAVLYELLTGSPPLVLSPQFALMENLRRVREEDPPAPSEHLSRHRLALATLAKERGIEPMKLIRTIRGELDWICGRALEKDRNRRYESAAALARDMEQYLAGEPVEASPLSATYKIGKLVRKHRIAVAVALAFVMTLVAATAFSTWKAIQAKRANDVSAAVRGFLEKDVLAQADPEQTDAEAKPEPDLTVRAALDRAAQRVSKRFPHQPLIEAEIRSTIASAYSGLGLYTEARPHFERSVELYRSSAGPEANETLGAQTSLAELDAKQGRFRESEAQHQRILEIRRRVLGNSHPDTLESMDQLAYLYYQENEYAKAASLLREVIHLKGRVFGPDSKETIVSEANMAAVHYRLNEREQAEALAAKIYTAMKRIFGADHPRTLLALGNLAFYRGDRGDFSGAAKLTEQVYEAKRRLLGPHHPDTLVSLNALASLAWAVGDVDRSAELYRQLVEGYRKTLGPEHPDTLVSAAYFGRAQNARGRAAEAEQVLREVHQSLVRVQGPSHPRTLMAGSMLAEVLRDRGSLSEAESLASSTLESTRRSRPGHWRISHCQLILGSVLAEKKRFEQAEPLLLSSFRELEHQQQVLPATENVLPRAAAIIRKMYAAWGKPVEQEQWRKLGEPTAQAKR